MESKDPRVKARSALHWENQQARKLMTDNGAVGVLVAELVREYLEFYDLGYSKQIYMPESGLGAKKEQREREQLADAANITRDN